MVITEKPTQASKIKQDGSEQTKSAESAEDMEALKKKLEVLTNIPKKKYPYPMTASQEVGWESELFDSHRPKYTFNKNMCAETNYVDNYVRMLHRNPLASKKGETVAPAKKWWNRSYFWNHKILLLILLEFPFVAITARGKLSAEFDIYTLILSFRDFCSIGTCFRIVGIEDCP